MEIQQIEPKTEEKEVLLSSKEGEKNGIRSIKCQYKVVNRGKIQHKFLKYSILLIDQMMAKK